MTDRELLQRVRCAACAQPLLQLHQEGFLSPKEEGSGEVLSSAHVYRTLTDAALLQTCPGCGAMLSPDQVVIVEGSKREKT